MGKKVNSLWEKADKFGSPEELAGIADEAIKKSVALFKRSEQVSILRELGDGVGNTNIKGVMVDLLVAICFMRGWIQFVLRRYRCLLMMVGRRGVWKSVCKRGRGLSRVFMVRIVRG